MNELMTMKSVYKHLKRCGSSVKETKVIKKIKKCLDGGENIDSMFPQKGPFKERYIGTILHYCLRDYYKIVEVLGPVAEYVFSRGANIAIEITSTKDSLRYRNAFDLAAHQYNSDSIRNNIFEMIKDRSLELYSAYGLTPFHIDCALDWKEYWNGSKRQSLCTAEVNASVSVESPFWPGMTPLLIAAKFENYELVKRLLDLGADPFVRDPEGNTPLHYVNVNDADYYDKYNPPFFDERLFASDGFENTFGPFTGENHFHIACRTCPQAVEVVKRYLDQGVSPDLPIQTSNCKDGWNIGKVGLHLATEFGCPDLIQLLLEYGAEINRKDSGGFNAFSCTRDYKSICALIEAGSTTDTIDIQFLLDFISSSSDKCRRAFFECIVRLTSLNKNLVTEYLTEVYNEFLNETMDDWNEAEYSMRCLKELKSLTDLGLREILDGTVQLTVQRNFKRKFGWLDSFDFESYRCYGKLLRIKIKPKVLIEYEKKTEKIEQAIPQMQRLFQSICHVPYLCAETILWNMKIAEIDQLMAE